MYRFDDAGRSWHLIGLAQETVRALAQAPSNPKVFVVGAIYGRVPLQDDGNNWERISPAGHDDLRNFDSVAFDPKDENIIYAERTTCLGRLWTAARTGLRLKQV